MCSCAYGSANMLYAGSIPTKLDKLTCDLIGVRPQTETSISRISLHMISLVFDCRLRPMMLDEPNRYEVADSGPAPH